MLAWNIMQVHCLAHLPRLGKRNQFNGSLTMHFKSQKVKHFIVFAKIGPMQNSEKVISGTHHEFLKMRLFTK